MANKSIFLLGVQVALLMAIYTVSVSEAQGCFCTFQYEPVCGSDGRTYSNSCKLGCERERNPNLRVFSQGECSESQSRPGIGSRPDRQNIPPCICTANYDPVCGTNGITYENSCKLGCADGTTLAYRGQCRRGNFNRPYGRF